MTVVTGDVDLERDRLLVERCQNGDADAFGDLYSLYHQRLVRHCAARLGSDALAEDVAQEACIRAWRAMDRFDADRAFYPWLQVIASNACTDVLRRQRRTVPLTELAGTAALDGGRGVEEQVTTAFDAALATGALEQLSERHRRVLHLREQLDWSVQEIAEHEGLESNAVDTLLWRARASLRRRFRALSEGAAAVVATGGAHLLSVRHRLFHLVHASDGPWGSTVRGRAAVAVMVVMGAGAASAPLTWSPATPARPTPVVHRGAPVPTVSSGGTRGPGTASGSVGAPIPGRTEPATPASGTGSADGSTVTVGSSRSGTVGIPGGSATDGAVASVPSSGPSVGPVSGVPKTVPGVVQSVGGTVGGVVGTVGGVVKALPTVSGAAGTPVVTIPTLSPVPLPILPLRSGQATSAAGTSAVTGLLGGLGVH